MIKSEAWLLSVALSFASFVSVALAEAQIAPAPGGGYQVLVEGKNSWPPKGPGCDRYIECCQKAGQEDSAIDLACKMNLGAYPDDNCGELLKKIKQLMTELKKRIPAECQK